MYHYVPSQIAVLFPHAHTHDSLDKSWFFRGEIHVFDGHVWWLPSGKRLHNYGNLHV